MKIHKTAFFGVLLALCATVALADAGADTRAAFLRVIDRPRVPLAAEVQPVQPLDGMTRLHFWFSSDATERVPGYLVLPDPQKFKAPRPAVIALHGTGGHKEGGEIVNIARKAAQRGFVAVAIDGRFHGERTRAGSGAAEYNDAIARAWREGKQHPFYYDTAWDVMRLIDFLATRNEVDTRRIGLTGISKGGIETYLAAAADPRIAVAVPYISVQSFKWSLDHGQWRARIATIQTAFNASAADAGQSIDDVEFVRRFYDRVVPGIYGPFDGPAMLSAIAPRPLLVVNSDSDANTPIAGVRLAVQTAKPVYASLNAADRIELRVQENTAHTVTPESIDAGLAWLVRWLQP